MEQVVLGLRQNVSIPLRPLRSFAFLCRHLEFAPASPDLGLRAKSGK
jgi:hypothetical protein